MTAVTKGFASQLGFSLGSALRFFLADRNPLLRWVKRACFAVVLTLLLVKSFTWIAGAVLSLVCFGLVVLALSKFGGSTKTSSPADGSIALNGRDVYGRELDCYGNVEGEYPHQN